MFSMQQGITFTEIWHIMYFFTGTLIWYRTHTYTYVHTHKDTQPSQTNRPTQPYKYILTPSATCSQKLSVLHWIFDWYYSLVGVVYLFIKCIKTKFFLRNTNNTDKNGVNKQNTHTKPLEKGNTGKRDGVPTMSLAVSDLFFTVQKMQVMTSPLFKLEIYH